MKYENTKKEEPNEFIRSELNAKQDLKACPLQVCRTSWCTNNNIHSFVYNNNQSKAQ